MASRLLLMGGHEFDRLDGNEVLRDFMLELADAKKPKVCLLPTASGDPDHQISAFRRSFGGRGAEVTDISLFRLGQNPVDLEEHFFNQDLIYVGGGSLVNLVAVWSAHGVYELLLEALSRGVLICGQSAGAMCWFERGITTSSGVAAMASGFGLIPGSLCVHYHRDPERRTAYLAAVAAGEPPGHGVDDQAGLLFEDGVVTRTVCARSGAGVWRVDAGGEAALEAEDITPGTADDGLADSLDDFRALKRWKTGSGIGRGR
jgi:dipeptidase E